MSLSLKLTAIHSLSLQVVTYTSNEILATPLQVFTAFLVLTHYFFPTRSDRGDEEAQRFFSIEKAINEYSGKGVCDLMDTHECDSGTQPPQCMVSCCVRSQNKHMRLYRHCVLLTRKPPPSLISFPQTSRDLMHCLNFRHALQRGGRVCLPRQWHRSSQHLRLRDKYHGSGVS